MDSHKQEIVEKLQSSNNILVTVSSNPSVDQLAACIGLTLLLNKLGKHATAVFSGEIPSTIEFLKPEDTIEKNTNSLRDFIIALDKSKADKLRYKVEDKVVKIFITPYRTSLSSDDLNFSQGDFNIDVVLALGVHQQTDLDQAITSHGRILHDATVACVNITPNGDLGTVNWSKQDASSLSELVVELAKSFDQPLLDEQIATALLTGIVAETDRFRNEKTSATTMSLSAELMSAGANQQLVAKELDHEVALRDNELSDTAPQPKQKPADDEPARKPDDGTLEIDHPGEHKEPPTQPEAEETEESEKPTESAESAEPEAPLDLPVPVDEPEEPAAEKPDEAAPPQDASRTLITEAPTLGGRLTANTTPEEQNLDPAIDPLAGSPNSRTLLQHDSPFPGKSAPKMPPTMPTPSDTPELQPAAITPPVPKAPQPFVLPTPAPPATSPVAPDRSQPPQFAPAPMTPPIPPAPAPMPQPAPTPVSLTEAEEPATGSAASSDDIDAVEKARQEVLKAISEQPDTNLPPVQALNAHPVDLGNHNALPDQMTPPSAPAPAVPAPLPPNVPELAPFAHSPADQPLTMPLPPSITLPPPQVTPPTNAPGTDSPNSPPPVPPPMTPPSWPPKQ